MTGPGSGPVAEPAKLIATGPAVRCGRVVSVDWLEASVKGMPLSELRDVLSKQLGEGFEIGALETVRDDAKGYDAKGPFGLRLRADKVGQVDRHGERQPWAGVRIPGQGCRTVGTDRILHLLEAMAAGGKVKVSRIDLALDDFDKAFTARQFAKACVDGFLDDENALLRPGVITRVKRDNWDWNRKKGGCFWLGGGKSERLLRVYDKDRESGGKTAATRMELQSRNRFATALADRLLMARREGRGFGDVFSEHVVAFVDLRVPVGARSESQTWSRVEFWQRIVGDASRALTPANEDGDVWAWLGSIRRQFRGALSVMLRAAGLMPGALARARHNQEEARRVVTGVCLVLGQDLPDLSTEHEVRLQQLGRELGRNVRRLIGGRALGP